MTLTAADPILDGLAEQQIEAMHQIKAWWSDGSPSRQIFRLSGYAGSGKTTCAVRLPAWLQVDATFCAFTGKAASVLNSKLSKAGAEPTAMTIHSLLYTPKEVRVYDRHFRRQKKVCTFTALWEADPKMIECPGCVQKDKDGNEIKKLKFEPKDPEEIALEVPLLIVDEMSMVGQDVVMDLLAPGVPVLVLGDPEQLPPIRGEENILTSVEPDYLLTEVHRNKGSVLDLATKVRSAKPSSRTLGLAGEQREVIGMNELLGFDQILCWKNITRWEMIQRLRYQMDRPEGRPVPGDRIMFLTNRRDEGVFNGMQEDVVDVKAGAESWLVQLSGGGWVEVAEGGFIGLREQQWAEKGGREGPVPATFANVVTVHKAQGSEWPRVCLLNESNGLRFLSEQNGMDKDQAGLYARRWLYTGITRASEEVVVVKSKGWSSE